MKHLLTLKFFRWLLFIDEDFLKKRNWPLKLVMLVWCVLSLFTGTAQIYVSSSGSDVSTGTSSFYPRKTVPKLTAGGTYLLKRGDTIYGAIQRIYNPSKRIIVRPYGTGNKPVLSMYVSIKPTAWVQDGTNRWKVDFSNSANFTGAISSSPNIGFLKLNRKTIVGAKKKTKDALAAQWDFFSDARYLYVYSTLKPNWLSGPVIEASTNRNAINISDNMTIEDIVIIGAGRNGIGANNQKNILIKRVDVREIGGCYLTGTTRFGNGIQLYNGGVNNVIDSCTVKQVYDVAYTMQTAATSGGDFVDCVFSNNLSDSCDQDFENTLKATGVQGYVRCKITGNNFRNAGYGWSYVLRPHRRGVSLLSYQWKTTKHDVVFEKNTIYNPRGALYYAADDSGITTQPIPPYTSRNNDIWLKSTTKLRMKIDGGEYPTYSWTIATHGDFTTKNQGKETGSTWHTIP